MADIQIDNAALASLTARGGPVDEHIHRIADRAYGISQFLVPQPPRPENPYATGALKASGKVQRNGASWEVEYGTNHAIYVELGTRYMRAEPFLRPALLAAVRSYD